MILGTNLVIPSDNIITVYSSNNVKFIVHVDELDIYTFYYIILNKDDKPIIEYEFRSSTSNQLSLIGIYNYIYLDTTYIYQYITRSSLHVHAYKLINSDKLIQYCNLETGKIDQEYKFDGHHNIVNLNRYYPNLTCSTEFIYKNNQLVKYIWNKSINHEFKKILNKYELKKDSIKIYGRMINNYTKGSETYQFKFDGDKLIQLGNLNITYTNDKISNVGYKIIYYQNTYLVNSLSTIRTGMITYYDQNIPLVVEMVDQHKSIIFKHYCED
jgi:hypothetical protein